MRILIAISEDVFARNEEPAAALVPTAAEHDVILAHTSGRPVGQELELALRNALPERDVVSLSTQVVLADGEPQAIAEIRSLRALLDRGSLVICAGGDCLPVVLDERGSMHRTRAPIDHDLSAALLARRLDADLLLMLGEFYPPPPPQLKAASRFAEATGRRAVLGALGDVAGMVRGEAGMEVGAPVA